MQKSNKLLSKKKIILIFFILFLSFIGSVYCSIQKQKSLFSSEFTEEVKPDYQNYLKLSFIKQDEAESALIYKDLNKTKKILEEAKQYAQKIPPSHELYQEAKATLEKIEKKELEVTNLIKQQEEENKKRLEKTLKTP